MCTYQPLLVFTLISISFFTSSLELSDAGATSELNLHTSGALIKASSHDIQTVHEEIKRIRRDEPKESRKENTFEREEIGWSKINEQVDMVIPLVLSHLQTLGIEYLELPNIKETISVTPLIITHEVGLYLTNGIVYNIAGVRRYGDALMTYANKSFICQFYLLIENLQFEYNFMLKLMALAGFGKVIGSLDNTIIYAELSVNVTDTRFNLNDFRIIEFSNINVQLDEIRIIRELSGAILSPITNLFKDRITTSISDGLKDQMQLLMADFDNKDPLELQKFAKNILSGLTGQVKE